LFFDSKGCFLTFFQINLYFFDRIRDSELPGKLVDALADTEKARTQHTKERAAKEKQDITLGDGTRWLINILRLHGAARIFLVHPQFLRICISQPKVVGWN
jgi:hypothetical protein